MSAQLTTSDWFALDEYIVFLYEANGLAVFESFVPGNAFYTFRYDDFDRLLMQLSGLSKTKMLLASEFLMRGYHIQDKDRLEGKIAYLFREEEQSYNRLLHEDT